jgi:hypothetical protein
MVTIRTKEDNAEFRQHPVSGWQRQVSLQVPVVGKVLPGDRPPISCSQSFRTILRFEGADFFLEDSPRAECL